MIHICLSPNWRISKILTAFMTKQQKFRLECRYCGWAAADILVPPIDEIAKKIINNNLDTYVEGFGMVNLTPSLKNELERIVTAFIALNETSRVHHKFQKERAALKRALKLCTRTASKIRKHLWRTVYEETYRANLKKENKADLMVYDKAKIRN